MEVLPFDTAKVPSPWRGVLEREVELLRERPDVLAIGIAGSWAQEDTWQHSDIDLEVVLRGDHPFSLRVTEPGDISVDFGVFGENIIDRLPYETRPIWDPEGVMKEALTARDLNEFLGRELVEDLTACQSQLERGETALEMDFKSSLVFLHHFAWTMSEVLTVAAGDNRTDKRRCTRLERAVKRRGREDLLERCSQLFGFPTTLRRSNVLLRLLRDGYKDIWSFFKGKPHGPVYMLQQPDSESWYRNRIEPVHRADPRDLVWIAYAEFPFVTYFLFRNLTDQEKLPLDLFQAAQGFPTQPRRWVERHTECLAPFHREDAKRLLQVAMGLIEDARELVDQGLYLR